ncbi:MAG: caspase family protein [Bacteroidota bacterium]
MRKLLFVTLLAHSLLLNGQELIDVAGRWVGNSSFMKANYHLTFEVRQTGSQLTGTSTTVSMDHKDSIVVAFNGVIDGKEVEIHAYDVLFKKGSGCLSNSLLTFSSEDEQSSLVGKWKGDMRLISCPPMVGGEVQVFRQNTPVPMKEPIATATVEIDEQDRVGRAMVSELDKRTYHGLFIGVQDHDDPEIEPLEHPNADAQTLAGLLTSSYGFLPGDMTQLLDPTRREIIEALDELGQKVGKRDQVLIFYAGHGVWDEELNQGYWLPKDAAMNSKVNWISNSTIRDHIRGIPSQHTLLITDACFSGGILRERAAFQNSRAMLELYKLPSRKAMTSGTLKTVPDKSVFMQYLVKSLSQNDSPLVSADELFRTFKVAVINNSPNGQVPQFGPILGAGDEGGEFIFKRTPE